MGRRFGSQAIFEGEEVADTGYEFLNGLRQAEEIRIREINKLRDNNIQRKRDLTEGKIEEIMKAREELVVIVCIHDEKLCDVCNAECGRVGYGSTDFKTGPPFHRYCRCLLQGTGKYGLFLFEGKTVSETDLAKLNELREEEAEYIAGQERRRRWDIEKERWETQEAIDYYFIYCRIYAPWYEVKCSHGTDPCQGQQGLATTLADAGCMPPYTNQTCWPEYAGYEVCDINELFFSPF